MSDQTDNTSQDENSPEGKNWRRSLEDQLAAEKEARINAEKAFAFNTVKGLDMSNPAHKFFAENYKGEMTPEKVAEAATANGFITNETDNGTTANIQGHQQIDAASQGAPPADIPGSDEAKLNAILNGTYNTLEEYNQAVKDAGYAHDQING